MSLYFVRRLKRTYIRAWRSAAIASLVYNSSHCRPRCSRAKIARQYSTDGNGHSGSGDVKSGQSDRQAVQKMIELLRSRQNDASLSEQSRQLPPSLLAMNNDAQSPTEEFNLAASDVIYDPAVLTIILERILSDGHVLDIQIGNGRGIFDALSSSGLTNSQKFEVDNYDIGRDLLEHMVHLYDNKWHSNVMRPSSAMLNRVEEQFGKNARKRRHAHQWDAICFTSCFHHFANLEHLRWIHSMLRPGGYAIFYWSYDPVLYQPPAAWVLPRFSRSRKKVPGVKYPPRSILERLRELKLTLRRRKRDISHVERAALDARLLQITREFGELYRTNSRSPFALQALMRIQIQLGSIEDQMVRKSMMESAVNSGLNQLAPDDEDIKPDVWQVGMAETLEKYREHSLPSVSEGNWIKLLYDMEHLWELSGLFRMPPESHSRTFSMRVDLATVLNMWKEDPNFWHLNPQVEGNMLEELRDVLKNSVDDEDLDEYGRVNMVFGSHITWLRKP
ncbi:hypothetical protein V1525DRAFT_407654 [Lipomyces kononenkoae]|uniref:Uncharacterized protein n=1 Tax=Lipomyces kononenkoae TaxID=34357 RepID=A0ACC3SX69_LIPKO